MTELSAWQKKEMAKCAVDPRSIQKPWLNINPCWYFITKYAKIYDEFSRDHIPFILWKKQVWLLERILTNGRNVVLKGRQLGITWLCITIALWLIVHGNGVSIGLYSMRETEAYDLLRRLRRMFEQLPSWMVQHLVQDEDQQSFWSFKNGTKIRALSAKSGDSYQFSFVILDEASLIPNLKQLLTRLLPALNSVPGSILAMISRSNKEEPNHEFHKRYIAGKRNIEENMVRWEGMFSSFLPWHANPTTSKKWYEAEKAEQLREYKHIDDLHCSYPGSDAEALAPSTSNKRIMRAWVIGNYKELRSIPGAEFKIDGIIHAEFLRLYKMPKMGMRYVIGCDCAEGLPTSDNSVSVVVELETGEECASLISTMTPADQAWDTWKISEFYNDAEILVERNNHGHSMIRELLNYNAFVLEGPDERYGYVTSTQSKIHLYTNLAETLKQVVQDRDLYEELELSGISPNKKNIPYLIHTLQIAQEIMGVERMSLKAPKGDHDDCAVAFAMAQMARMLEPVEGVERADYTRF